MNIFVLDDSPKISAEYMCDKHINKMVVESAQMLCTAHRMLDGVETMKPSVSGKRTLRYFEMPEPDESLLYRAAHMKHPCNIWIRQTEDNYLWLYDHFMYLGEEYTYRYGKSHKSIELLGERLCEAPRNLTRSGQTDFVLAMPDKYKTICPITSYRNYYKGDKTFAKWERNRKQPEWWNESKEYQVVL